MLLKDNPATQIAWKIGIIHRLHSQKISGVSEDFGLHPGQTRILSTVGEMNGSTQKELADLLRITPPSMAVSIKRMQKAGLVEKAADQEDLRSNRIFITEKGERIRKDSLSEFIRYDNSLVRGFSPEEIAQLNDYLTRIQVNLKEANYQNA